MTESSSRFVMVLISVYCRALWSAEEVHQRDGKDEEIRSVAADLVALLVVGSAL
jgi:hypothetical protein